jgi:long-chain acyl-CoA synthetase
VRLLAPKVVLSHVVHRWSPCGPVYNLGRRFVELAGLDEIRWLSVLGERTDDLPVPGLDQPALLSWTSGTTGSPKAFLLTHRNIATNVGALLELAVVGPQDRALLPLPLHHAYPFIVGMLTTLTIGTVIVLPGGATGPLLMRAMREGEVTTIIGVPRLYDALWTAIETRVTTRGATVRLIWRALLKSASLVQRSTGLRLGRRLFAPIRRGIVARLRLLVSGGARLEQETEERLEALGWTVLSGYGLAETASLFTGNRPAASFGQRRAAARRRRDPHYPTRRGGDRRD